MTKIPLDTSESKASNQFEVVNIDIIQWIDSCGVSEMWVKVEDLPENCPRFWSVGFVVRETEESLTIAATCGDEEIGEVVSIPKVAVLQRVTLAKKNFRYRDKIKEDI